MHASRASVTLTQVELGNGVRGQWEAGGTSKLREHDLSAMPVAGLDNGT
jgi:hypothetical protein